MKWESYSHPISDIRDWDSNNRLELKPDFQRNEVWSRAAQVMLIDTILNDIPIPKIYIKSTISEGNTYRIVIDGQQRLTAILKFLKDKLVLKSPYNGDYVGLKFSELPEETKNAILRYKVDINEIFNPTEEEIRDLYSRVNKYTVQLNKQELRKADFPGDFINLAELLSDMPFFEESRIFSTKQRRRMLDVEYIEELITIIIYGIQDKKDYIDDVCENNIKMEKKDIVCSYFKNVLIDIERIFDPSSFPICNTRFRQKSDFYSLFAAVFELQQTNTLNCDKLDDVRCKLKEMNEKIEPSSEIEEYREYATNCLSDANSITNRKWRKDYLKSIISNCYAV